MSSNLIKSYSDKTYNYTTIVRHEGTVIAFAMDSQRRIYYTVLEVDNPNVASPLDVDHWSVNPRELEFPNEIAEVGFGLADQTLLPKVRQGSVTPITPGTSVPIEEVDRFLSTTARLTANAPFQVWSDGRHVYLFRQAIAFDHPDMVYVVSGAGSDSGRIVLRSETDGGGGQTFNNQPVTPIVNSTLLVDRFVLSQGGVSRSSNGANQAGDQYSLQLTQEVRFRRSRSKTRPQSSKDTLGARDMEDRPFLEPTQELSFIRNLQNGRFSVLLLPTQVVRVDRWQFFAYNSRTQMIDSYNVERSPDGLFNTRGTQGGTREGFAEFALSFNQPDDHVQLNQIGPSDQTGIRFGNAFTQEAWIFPKETVPTSVNSLGRALLTSNGNAPDAAPSIWVERNTRLRLGFGDGTTWHEVVTGSILVPDRWQHVAVSFDGNLYRVYIDSQLRYQSAPETFANRQPANTPLRYIGAPTDSFYGLIDEVRIWNRDRSQSEIEVTLNQRLTGQEPDLRHYWRLDEGAGIAVADQTGNTEVSLIVGAEWVTSTAPLGSNSSITINSFRLHEVQTEESREDVLRQRSIQSGLTSLLYYHQENAPTGYDQEEKPLKQSARVMLAMATRLEGNNASATANPRHEIAVLDFAVSASGMLTQIPDNLRLQPIRETSSDTHAEVVNQINRALNGEDINPTIPGALGTRRLQQISPNLTTAPYRGLLNLGDLTIGEAISGLIINRNVLAFERSQPTRSPEEIREINQALDRLRTALSQVAQILSDPSYSSQNQQLEEIGNLEKEVIDLQDQTAQLRQSISDYDRARTTVNAVIDRRPINLAIPGELENTPLRQISPNIPNVSIYSGRDQISDIGTLSLYRAVAGLITARDVLAAGIRSDVAPAINRLEAALRQISQALSNASTSMAEELRRKTQQLADTRHQLQMQQAALRGDVELPMPLMHRDRSGLTLAGGILSFAWTNDTPLLYDSATGRLALYFRGENDQFFVAYYDTLTQRARYTLNDGSGVTRVTCLNRSVEAEFDRLTIQVADGETPATCMVTIGFMTPSETTGEDEVRPIETWKQVPRSAEAFASVLNGDAGDRVFVGSGTLQVINGRVERLTLPSGVERSLPAGATLVVGDIKVILQQAIKTGATDLPITSDVINPPREMRPVFYLEYDYAVNASINPLESSLLNQPEANLLDGSLLIAAASTGDGGAIANQKVQTGATLSARWVAATPGHALVLNGINSHVSGSNPSPLVAEDDITLEAWIKPDRLTDLARIIHHRLGNSSYTLGLTPGPQVALHLNGSSDYVRIPYQDVLSFAGVVTLEAWIKPDDFTLPGTIIGNLASVAATGTTTGTWLRINNRSNAGVNQVGYEIGSSRSSASSPERFTFFPIPDMSVVQGRWTHVAAVYTGNSWMVYQNGQLLGDQITSPQPAGREVNQADWSLGASLATSRNVPFDFFRGALDDVRIWRRMLTQTEIQANMNHRLAGNEPNLVGYWRFANNAASDYSNNDNHGMISGTPSFTDSPILAYQVFAGVQRQIIRTNSTFAPDIWTHWAMVFNQSYALRFDGSSTSRLNAGNNVTLDINGDLSIEAFLQLDNLDQHYCVLSKGRIDDGSDDAQGVPYLLAISSEGRLVFAFEDVDRHNHVFVTESFNQRIQANRFHRIAVTRQRINSTSELTSNTNATALPPTVRTEYHVRFYLDGEGVDGFIDAGSANQPLLIASNNQALEISSDFRIASGFVGSINGVTLSREAVQQIRADSDPQAAGRQTRAALGLNPGVSLDEFFDRAVSFVPFQGVISEIRLWNTTLPEGAIGGRIRGNEQGLVSWWRLEENEGNLTYDAKSNNHATLQGTVQWVKNPDPQGSSLTLYQNGEVVTDVSPVPLDTGEALIINSAQFTLGAIQYRNGEYQEHYKGELEEIRIWKQARTQEQIQDNLFRRLLGERELLIARYTFEPSAHNQLIDRSLNGNTLSVVQGNYVLSTAPISEETPQVRNALAGIRTAFNDSIQSQPAIAEYGDLQYDTENNLIGVFKRCYAYIKDGQWQIITGFKVGDLITEWVGQVQFDPQLMGYIEGAPPVPSENLTVTSVNLGEFVDYDGASTVEIAQAQNTTYTFAASKDHGFNTEVEAFAGVGFISETEAGEIIATNIEKSEVIVGIRSKFEASTSFLESATRGVGRTTTRNSQTTITGRVENSDQLAYPDLGRRFIPDNIGFALVQSETADVFALRLQHNNALVSYQMRPNPDIPPDTNVINFPINLHYTKQGTLDGKVGLATDIDYPNALAYSSDSSYFKPIEAYALRNQIQRDEERLRSYYEQYDAGSRGRRENARQFSEQDLAAGRLVERLADQLPNIYKRNLVNNYVWTADGGLFAETQETLDVVQETLGGSFNFKGLLGLSVETGTAFKVAFKGSLQALFGGHLNLNVTKSQQSETSFALNVSLDKVERNIFQYDEQGRVVLDSNDPLRARPVKQPGKVDAYRFLSFYLEPHSDHFETFFNQVVDPIWLEQSDAPSAVALRQTRQNDRKPPCWRVMHRVTYVSRILPRLSNPTMPPLERQLAQLSIDSNYELVRRLQPFVIDQIDNYAAFVTAVQRAVATYLPELTPHIETIVQFMLLYYGVIDQADSQSNDDLPTLFNGRAPNRTPIVDAGPNQIIALSDAAQLQGLVADDRLDNSSLFLTWMKVEGVGTVQFGDIYALNTTAQFSQRGRYLLRLIANDGLLTSSDDITIIVNEAPIVNAGADVEIGPRGSVDLVGELLSNGLGDPKEGKVTVEWTVEGAGAVTFSNPRSLRTTVTFQRSGNYILKLTANNGLLSGSDFVTVSVAERVRSSLQALYTFDETTGTIVRDGVGKQPLTVESESAVVWNSGKLTLQQATRLSATNINNLINAIQTTNELTIEAWLTPANAIVDGLRRILTLSSGPAARNFILGQQGDRFYFAIRTSTTNANASDQALSVGTVTTTLTHVVCTRDAAGLMGIYVNGQAVASRTLQGNFSTWDRSFTLTLGNEVGDLGDDSLQNSRADRAWLGSFHLVALYNRALTASEVSQNYAYGADTNLSPMVEAGENQVITLPQSAQLSSVLQDERLSSNQLLVRWEQVSGPVNTTIQTPNALNTIVSFVRNGRYVFRLTVSDGELIASDEVTVTVNQTPIVEVSPIQPVNLPDTLQLSAQIHNNGLGDPQQGRLTSAWSRISGPAAVQFSNPASLTPTVTFPRNGTYVLRLTVDNGFASVTQDVVAIVNQTPDIAASVPPLVTLPGTANLSGQILNDGLGSTNGTVTTTWSLVSGAGAVTFQTPNALNTTAIFSASGRYLLRLTVNNGHLTTTRDVTITVNQAPTVDAGPDRLIILPAAAELDGTVSDDGLPETPGRLSIRWSKVSGPGNVTFANEQTDYTTARFSAGGTYVLRLTANDGAVSVSDDVTVIVNQAPTVDAGPDQLVALPVTVENGAVRNGTPAIATLNGRVSDDQLPAPANLTTTWQKISGPEVTFANPNSTTTTVALPEQGRYVLRLVADDGAADTNDEVEIVVTHRVIAGLQAFYTFEEGNGNTIRDRSLAGQALDLKAPPNTPIQWLSNERGIRVAQPMLISAATPATRLTNALRTSNALTIEAWIKPINSVLTENIPARIVTLSTDTTRRNFTLGQVENSYVLRLRSGRDDPNGTNQTLTAGTIDLAQPSHLVVTHDASGLTVMYLNGSEVGRRQIRGNFSSWDSTFGLAIGNEFTNDRAWLGEYYLVAIYDRTLSPAEVFQNFTARI